MVADAYADKYFAAAPPDEIGGAIISQLNRQKERTDKRSRDFSTAYKQSYSSISTSAGSGMRVERGGEQGELSKIRVNNASSIQKSLLGLLLASKMNWRPQAKNGDTADRAAILKASNTLEWLWKIRRLNGTVTRWVDQALRYGEAFVFAPWNLAIGPPAGIDGRKQGDIDFHNVLPWHVFRDEAYNDFKQCPWVCVRLYENRWDFAAQYPTTITGESTESLMSSANLESDTQLQINDGSKPGTDVCPVYYFFHKPTAAVPQGREVLFRNSGCVVLDTPLRYSGIPVKRLAPDELDDTTSGYSTFSDVLAAQEVSDGIESSISSNILTFGTQSIALQEGTKFEAKDVRGMRVVYVRQGGMEPRAIQLTASPKEAFEHLDHLKGAQRDLMGLNDVAMGQPQTAQMNAEAFSILAGMAQQRNAPVQQKILDAVGELGAHALDTINKFYSEPRSIAVAGRASKSFSKLELKQGDLEPIQSVIVDIGSPMEQSVAGRTQLAIMLKDMGAVKSAEQIAQVMETGRLEPVTDPLRAAQLLVDHENDELSQGKPVQPDYLDDHAFHALQHKSVIDNPEIRKTPEAMTALRAHIDEHYLLFYGIKPMQPPAMPGMPPPPPLSASEQVRADPGWSIKMKQLLGQQTPQMAAPMGGMPGEPQEQATEQGVAALAQPVPGQTQPPQGPQSPVGPPQ